MNFTHPYTEDFLIERAVRNAIHRRDFDAPRWVAVRDTFAVGSGTARELCLHHGLDPDEPVRGFRCERCEQEMLDIEEADHGN